MSFFSKTRRNIEKTTTSTISLILALIAWILTFFVQLFIHSLFFLPYNKREEISSIVFRTFSSMFIIDLNPCWDLKLVGGMPSRDKFDNPKIVMYNHKSNVDALFGCRFLPGKLRFVAKRVLFNFPFGGWDMFLAGDVPVYFKRKSDGNDFVSKSDIMKLNNRLLKGLKNNISYVTFPEGSRAKHDKLQELKSGMFMVAKSANVDILPGYIHNSSSCWAVGDALPSFGKSYICYGEVIKTESKTVEELKKEVKEQFFCLEKKVVSKIPYLK